MTLLMWTLAVAVVTAIACAFCGVFLVIKREAFVSEGLSHAVLPGIIVAFIVFQDRSSPWLVIAAGLTGLLMIWLVQMIGKTRLVESDAALGIVFAGLFSVGIILSSLNLSQVHFHADCIIDGNLSFAALSPFEFGGRYYGPKAFVVMLATLLVLITFVSLFYKEMKLMAFDQPLSKLLGFRPSVLHTIWLALVSITAVAAFETAGTVLVVAMMIAPPAAANLLTNRLSAMLVISPLIGTVSAIVGVYLGAYLDISPTGPIAAMSGLVFLVIVFLAPTRGVVSRLVRHSRNREYLLRHLVLSFLDRNPANATLHEFVRRYNCSDQLAGRPLIGVVNPVL